MISSGLKDRDWSLRSAKCPRIFTWTLAGSVGRQFEKVESWRLPASFQGRESAMRRMGWQGCGIFGSFAGLQLLKLEFHLPSSSARFSLFTLNSMRRYFSMTHFRCSISCAFQRCSRISSVFRVSLSSESDQPALLHRSAPSALPPSSGFQTPIRIRWVDSVILTAEVFLLLLVPTSRG